MNNQIAISTEGLSKWYGDITAVSDLDLAVPSGSIYGFLGSNGAGKTTTIQLLTTLTQPTSGCASINGTPITDRTAVTRQIGFLPESPPLYYNLTASEQLDLGANLRDLPESAARINSLLTRLDLRDDADTQIANYSNGIYQKTIFIGNIISTYSLGIQSGFVISSMILNVVAVALAPAIGMRIPRFSSSMITQSDEIMPPSMTAVFVYTLAVGLLGGGVLFVLLAPTNVYESIINESGLVKWVRLGCVVGWLGITLAIARVGYNDAIRKFEQYTVY